MALIFGVEGCCRRSELANIKLQDIEDKQNMVIVKIPDTKTNKPRSFVVTKHLYPYYKKYSSLRPANTESDRFFLCYRNQKCIKQAIGINTFGNMPKVIARYLQLKDPDLYTGHCLRRTSATIFVNSGGDMINLKRHGGWSSSAVAESYFDESLNNKIKISQQISNSILQSNQTKPSFTITSNSLNQSTSHQYSHSMNASSSSSMTAATINESTLGNEENIPNNLNIPNLDKASAIHININNCSNISLNMKDFNLP